MEDQNPQDPIREYSANPGAFKNHDDLNLGGNHLIHAPVDQSVGPTTLKNESYSSGDDAQWAANTLDAHYASQAADHFSSGRNLGPVWERGSTIPDLSSVEEDGRKYQAYRDGKYLLPNDGSEQDRLDFQHTQWILLLDGALALAPIQRPARVLDIGTGTGIWALEFAEQNPDSEVVGTDLSAIQPTRNLPNCTFVQEDVEDEWTVPGIFDYIHLRMVVTCFSSPKSVIRTLFDKVRPGGWVEYQDVVLQPGDVDGSLQTVSPSIRRWAYLNLAGAATLGRDWNCTARYKDWMIEAGFVDVSEHVIQVPGNGWPTDPKQQEIGEYCAINFLQGVEAVCLKCMKGGLGYSTEEVQRTISAVKKDIVDKTIHYYWPHYVVYGRRPYDHESAPPPLTSTLLANTGY